MESFHLDYISCLLSILSTVLVGRKLWFGLIVASFNSVIVCVIGFHTLQFGFIPANLFCIAINVFSVRSWLKDRHARSESTTSPEIRRNKPVVVPWPASPRILRARKQALAS